MGQFSMLPIKSLQFMITDFTRQPMKTKFYQGQNHTDRSVLLALRRLKDNSGSPDTPFSWLHPLDSGSCFSRLRSQITEAQSFSGKIHPLPHSQTILLFMQPQRAFIVLTKSRRETLPRPFMRSGQPPRTLPPKKHTPHTCDPTVKFLNPTLACIPKCQTHRHQPSPVLRGPRRCLLSTLGDRSPCQCLADCWRDSAMESGWTTSPR